MTPEAIAREAAEALVRVRQAQDASTSYPHALLVGDYGAYHHADVVTAVRDATFIRRQVAAAIQAAIERALREVPVPGGMSAQRLAELDGAPQALSDQLAEARRSGRAALSVELLAADLALFRELLADNNHLRRVLHDCGQDGTAAVWSAGYGVGYEAGHAAGAEAQRKADVLRAVGVTDAYAASPPQWYAANAVTVGMHDEPLVTPPEG